MQRRFRLYWKVKVQVWSFARLGQWPNSPQETLDGHNCLCGVAYLSGKLLIGKGIPLKQHMIATYSTRRFASFRPLCHYANMQSKATKDGEKKTQRFIETPATCTTCCTDQCSKDHTPWRNSVGHNCLWDKNPTTKPLQNWISPKCFKFDSFTICCCLIYFPDFWQFQYSCSSKISNSV